MITQSVIDELNAEAMRALFLWRETELPKLRERYLSSGIVPREAIEDEIISVAEIAADPHEVWQYDRWWRMWRRVEIEG